MLGVGGLAVLQQALSLVLIGSRHGCQAGGKPDAGPSGVHAFMVGRVGLRGAWASALQLCAHRLCPSWPRRGASVQEQISGPRPDLPIPVGLSCVGLAMPLLLHLLDSNPFVDFRLVPLLMS